MHAPGRKSFTVSVTLKKEILWFSLKVAPTYFMVPASDETIKYLPITFASFKRSAFNGFLSFEMHKKVKSCPRTED